MFCMRVLEGQMKDNRLHCCYVGDVEGKQLYILILPDASSAAAWSLISLRCRGGDELLSKFI